MAGIALALLVTGTPPSVRAESAVYEREAVIRGPVEVVWGLLTTEEGIRSWLAPQADVDLRVGGLVRTHQDPEGVLGDAQTAVSRVLTLRPKKSFSFRVEQTPQGYPMANLIEGTWYDVALDALPGGRTRIRCVGNGLATGMAAYMVRPVFNQGLDLVFDHLQKAVARRLELEEDRGLKAGGKKKS